MISIRDDSGLSLAELLVVTVLISVIMSASYFMFNAAQGMNDIAMARTSATDDAQAAIDRMTRELRETQVDRTSDENPIGGVLKVANANEISFMSDLNHDQVPELVRYYVDSGALKRTVANATNSQAPFTFGTAGTPMVLIKKLGTTSYPIFCYHDRTPNATAVCGPDKHGFNIITTSDPYNTSPKVAMVGILLNVPGTSGSKTVTVTSRALVRMRTVDSELE
jgi:prepilin-type N-terminal cleavage/methylation domain-containing protein